MVSVPRPVAAALRSIWRARHPLVVISAFVSVRVYAFFAVGIRFDAAPLAEYMQFVDPKLLRTDLLRSLLYLRDQPPLFNLFIGLVLKAAPRDPAPVFELAFRLLGLAGALAAYSLAKRLGAGRWPAAFIAIALSSLPCAVLYENWLFYAYPLGVLWVVAALAIERALASPSRRTALGAASALSVIALMRGTFHLFVYLGILAIVVLVRRKHAKEIAVGAALPTVLVTALYVKHIIVFGGIVIGGFYRGTNLAIMQMNQMDPVGLSHAWSTHQIPRSCPQGTTSYIDLLELTGREHPHPPPPRGVAILDAQWKSTGMTNWNSSLAAVMGQDCEVTAAELRAMVPHAYYRAVKSNAVRFLTPADQTWPFVRVGANQNADRLRKLNEWADDHLAVQIGADTTSVTVVVALVAAMVAPLLAFYRALSKPKHHAPRWARTRFLVLVFSAGVLVYSGTVAILYSLGDHNRYRAEVMPLVWVTLGAAFFAMLRTGWRWGRRRRRARRPNASPLTSSVASP